YPGRWAKRRENKTPSRSGILGRRSDSTRRFRKSAAIDSGSPGTTSHSWTPADSRTGLLLPATLVSATAARLTRICRRTWSCTSIFCPPSARAADTSGWRGHGNGQQLSCGSIVLPHHLPRDREALLCGCGRTRRYDTANGLARDIKRYLLSQSAEAPVT